MKVRVASVGDVLPGGIIMVKAEGVEMVLCNHEGSFYALERRCGHMSAPLELGTLNQYILTCPMHSAQFSVITGESLSGAIPLNASPPKKDGPEPVPGYLAALVNATRTMDVKRFQVTVEGYAVFVEV